MIKFLHLQALGYIAPIFISFATVIWMAYQRTQAEIDRDYWRNINRVNARYMVTLKAMLECWYFKRPKPESFEPPPGLTEKEAMAEFDDIYARTEGSMKSSKKLEMAN